MAAPRNPPSGVLFATNKTYKNATPIKKMMAAQISATTAARPLRRSNSNSSALAA
jgi:hypothetical protein